MAAACQIELTSCMLSRLETNLFCERIGHAAASDEDRRLGLLHHFEQRDPCMRILCPAFNFRLVSKVMFLTDSNLIFGNAGGE